MKSFLKDKQQAGRISAIGAILVFMTAIALYYLQNDYTGVKYINSFGYFILFVTSVMVMVHAFLNKKNYREITVGFSVFAFLSAAAYILSICMKSQRLSDVINEIAILCLAPVCLGAVAESAVKCRFFLGWLYRIAAIVLCIVPVAAFYIIPAQFMQVVFKISLAVSVLVFLAGIVFAVIDIIKRKENFIGWTYIFTFLPFAWLTAERIFSIDKLMRTSKGIALIAASLMLVAIVYDKD